MSHAIVSCLPSNLQKKRNARDTGRILKTQNYFLKQNREKRSQSSERIIFVLSVLYYVSVYFCILIFVFFFDYFATTPAALASLLGSVVSPILNFLKAGSSVAILLKCWLIFSLADSASFWTEKENFKKRLLDIFENSREK